jgi:hypothetical protein
VTQITSITLADGTPLLSSAVGVLRDMTAATSTIVRICPCTRSTGINGRGRRKVCGVLTFTGICGKHRRRLHRRQRRHVAEG